MPIFNPKLFEKRVKEAKEKGNKLTYKVIHKNVIGICCITLEAHYYVATDIGNFNFTDESYIIKENQPFYRQQIPDNKRMQIKELGHITKSNKKTYLPFAPGVCCKGDVVLNIITNIEVFRLKETFINNDFPLSKAAWNFYKTHYDEIRNFLENGDL